MTNRFIFILLFFLFCSDIAFSQDTTFVDAKWNKTTKKDAFYFSISTKKGTKWLRMDYFAKSGKLQMKGLFSSLLPEIRDGYFEWYFENGKLKHKGSYDNGKEDGQHLWYNENGNLEANENFINGVRSGEYEEYFPNGKLKDKSSFSNGAQSGWTEYYREDGSKQSEGNFKNNNRNGIWKYYDEKGKLLGADTIQTEYKLAKDNLFLQLPNDEWHLTLNEDPTHYIFKREAVTDSEGRSIIPAIMVYAGEEKKYKGNVVMYSNDNLKRLTGLKIIESLKFGDSGYPLSFKNGLFKRAQYAQNNVDHILLIIQIINDKDVGMQVYMDMTKEIYEKYGPEFWTTIRSLKQID